jgi:hypothetical protein
LFGMLIMASHITNATKAGIRSGPSSGRCSGHLEDRRPRRAA